MNIFPTLLLLSSLSSFFFGPPMPGRTIHTPFDSSVSVMIDDYTIGSGSIVKIKGETYVLTAQHVAEAESITQFCNPSDICIPMDDYDSWIMGDEYYMFSDTEDWALYPLEDSPLRGLPLSTKVELGDSVTIIASPAGMRNITVRGYVAKMFEDSFQLDAFAYYGSSGGPVFDKKGRVIGIVVAVPVPGGMPLPALPLCVSSESILDGLEEHLEELEEEIEESKQGEK